MSQPFRIGFIGSGCQAIEQIANVTQSKYGKVSAICDTNQTIARQTAKIYQVPYFRDYRDMIDEIQLDAVWICVPHNAHFEIAMYAMSRYLHVIKEKPFAISVREGKELANHSRKMKRSIYTIMQRRKHSSYLRKKITQRDRFSFFVPFVLHL